MTNILTYVKSTQFSRVHIDQTGQFDKNKSLSEPLNRDSAEIWIISVPTGEYFDFQNMNLCR